MNLFKIKIKYYKTIFNALLIKNSYIHLNIKTYAYVILIKSYYFINEKMKNPLKKN
jgi:hypothetical protein